MGIYRAALGETVLAVRVVSSFLCGIVAGLLIYFIYRKSHFFISPPLLNKGERDTAPNLLCVISKILAKLESSPLLPRLQRQLIYPAAEISEQISTAGMEASGTSNMKLMMNGAITLGTMDGANIEIVNLAGIENEKIFGLTAPEVDELRSSHSHFAWDMYNEDRDRLGRVIDELTDATFAGLSGDFGSIHNELMSGNDYDFVMKDFRSYVEAWEELTRDYVADRRGWNRKALHNTASSGWFSSDRTIREYRDEIWHA